MIEGLRLLPWLKEAIRRDGDQVGISNCEECKASLAQLPRQAIGCGYEPKTKLIQINMWHPPPAFSGPDPTVCAGYSTALPEVLETELARAHWSKGQNIGDSEDLQHAVVILDGSFSELQSWLMTPAKEGGGG